MKKPTFASELKEWRKSRGLSQSEAAEALGLSVRTLQNWEIGRNEPNELTREGLQARMQKVPLKKQEKQR